VLRLAGCLLLVSTLAGAAPPSETEQRFRAEVSAISGKAGDEYIRATAAGEAAKWDEALAHYRRSADLAPNSDHPHRRMCGVLANLGRADEAVAECETALSLAPNSAYDKMALASALAQTKRDLPRALALAKEALPKLSADPIALGMYCTVLLDTHTMPGIDHELDDCIVHLYVLDPSGMESNYLGAIVAALRGNRELAHNRLEVARTAGLPDAEYTALAADIDGRATPKQPLTSLAADPPSRHSMGKMVLAFAAGSVGAAALVLIGARLLRRRKL
jgi:tetratricopeptide (TPR) repeat protein